jgi:signal transduction histidine kinase
VRVPARLVPRSLRLSVQLLFAFVGLVVATTVALSVTAYQASVQTMEEEARRDVSSVAQAREQTLNDLLALRQRRAEGFLLSLRSLCGEPAGARGFGFSEECVGTLVEEMRITERATGALLTFRDRYLHASGETVAQGAPVPPALALVVPRRRGEADLLMRADLGELALTLQFDGADLQAFFDDPSALRGSGEVFLVGPRGEFLTSPRFAAVRGTPPGARVAEPLRECRAFAGERISIDYRCVLTLHGFRPVEAIGGCIDAHIPYSEVLDAAEQLRADLVLRGGVIALGGALLSLVAAYRIAAPVRRLARSARLIQAGNFRHPIPVGGPSEVRALGEALAAMAADLATLVTTEQSARASAESASRRKDRMLAIVSHELRTPLNAILGWTSLLRTGLLDGDKTSRAVDGIERSARMQQQLIEDLLDLSRIVAGRLRVDRVAVGLSSPIQDALDAVRPLAVERGVQLESVLHEDLQVAGDPRRLQQVFWNLLSNAVKFTPSGGLVSVRMRRAGKHAVVAVADTGVGIEPEFLPHVFEWFRQADRRVAREETGLGLGLGLVKQLVELHGGTVKAVSEGVGKGTTFTVRLPLGDR